MFSPPSFNPSFYSDFAAGMNRKYADIEKRTEGDYQKNLAEAYQRRELGAQVAPDAESTRALQEAQGFSARAGGQQALESAATISAKRFMKPEWLGAAYDSHPDIAGTTNLPPPTGGTGAPAARPPIQFQTLPSPSLIRPQPQAPSQVLSIRPLPALGLREGTSDVKGKGKGGSPRGLEALLPMLVAAMQGGGGGGSPPAQGLKKGTANVKSKGNKGKASKSDGPSPEGLEALLSALAAGGAGGAAAPPMPAAPPGFAAGTPSVEPAPGYPFGAGYLFGATAVPGRGSGTTDTVPAMLAPHEAVLNRAAADMVGRGLIAALNKRGVQQMGMNRGVT
jgi:hypothetical protein